MCLLDKLALVTQIIVCVCVGGGGGGGGGGWVVAVEEGN
jgi:hypothetical protein